MIEISTAAATRLSSEEFARALRQGRGAAPMHVKAHGLAGAENILLAACIEEQAYDAQCEGHRAEWLYAMFKAAPQYEFFQRQLIAALRNPPEDCSLEQLCELVALMAGDGDAAAGDALRTFYWSQDSSEVVDASGAHALVRLDGLPALVAIARQNGALLQINPDAFIDSLEGLVDGEDALTVAVAELARHAQDDVAIAAYLRHEQGAIDESLSFRQASPEERLARRQKQDAEHLEKFSLDHVLAAAAQHDRGRGKFFRFGRLCGTEALKTVMQRLEDEPDIKCCLCLLWVFHDVAPPYLPVRLWQLAEHADPEVRDAALIALAQASDPAIGEFGRRWLARGSLDAKDAAVIELFARNYQAGDAARILAALEPLQTGEWEAHTIGFSIRYVGERNNSAETAGLLLWLYRTNPCTICRGHAVELLIESNCLPPEIAGECAFDAREAVRALVKAAQTTRC